MVFIHDTRRARGRRRPRQHAPRATTARTPCRRLADLDAFLVGEPLHRARSAATTPSSRGARHPPPPARLWDVDRDGAVPLVNAMLRDGRRSPGS